MHGRGVCDSPAKKERKLGTASHPISELTVTVAAWDMPWKGRNSGWFAVSRVATQNKLPSLQ